MHGPTLVPVFNTGIAIVPGIVNIDQYTGRRQDPCTGTYTRVLPRTRVVLEYVHVYVHVYVRVYRDSMLPGYYSQCIHDMYSMLLKTGSTARMTIPV